VTKSKTRNAKPTYPKGFKFRAALNSPNRIFPTDLVLPQNGQGRPVTFLNIQRDGPELKPDERIANSLKIQSKARSESKRIESLSRCSFSISNFETKNWAIRFITNLIAQLRFLVA
jgi:hypothetical protein